MQPWTGRGVLVTQSRSSWRNWPMLDVRVGWNAGERLEQIAALEQMGVTWLISNVIGDDPAASEDTIRKFGTEVVQMQGS
jgi:hypothetical protein